MAKAETKEPVKDVVAIKKANLQQLQVTIVGKTPYMQHRFGPKAIAKMMADQMAGSQQKSKSRSKPPKDFDAIYEEAKHISTDGWLGIPCSAIRNACISACRAVGFKMTHAKLALWAVADGFDQADGTPLIRITKGEPTRHVGPARNDNGSIDIRARPMWMPGWEAVVRVEFDADMLTASDVANLLERAGLQVGIGEGRNDSRESAGIGYGSFAIKRSEVA